MSWSTKVGVAVIVLIILSGGLAAPSAKPDGKSAERRMDVIDVNKSSRSTGIDNKWTPMKPAKQWIYEGTSVEDDRQVHAKGGLRKVAPWF